MTEATKEIKKILDDLGNKDNYIEEFGCQYKKINLYDSFQLLDYITNLQQDLDKAIDTIEKNRQFYKCRMDEYVDLKKENERLNNKIKEQNLLLIEFQDMEQKVNIYKSRCEKAIEYIENNKKETSSHFNGKEYVYRNFTLFCEPNDLLNILNGSDEK